MFDLIAGLPLHPLVVHAAVVLVPAAAVAVLLAAVWPRFRKWAGYVPLGLSIAGLIATEVAEKSGEALEKRVDESALVETHTQMAGGLAPLMALLLLASIALLWWHKNRGVDAAPRTPQWLGTVIVVLALVAAAGTTVQVIRIGHSGATAVWSEDVKTS